MVGRPDSRELDWRQVRALLVTSLRLDLRAGTAREGAAPRGGAGRILRMLAAYMLTGAVAAFFMDAAPTPYVAAFVFLCSQSVVIGAVVVLDFHAVVLSPEDFRVIGHQPITSRTFFVARLLHVMAYTQALSAAFSLAPLYVLVARVARGDLAVAAAGGLASVYGTALVTLAGILAYAAAVRFVSPRRLRAVLSYTQLLLSVSVYAGLLLVRRRRSLDALTALSPDTTPLALLLPPSWPAGLVAIAAGEGSVAAWVGVAMGGAALAAMTLFAVRILSLGYAERLGAFAVESDPKGRIDGPAAYAAARVRGWLARLRSPESNAIAVLIRRQLRHDHRFRLGVLGVVPLTLLYLIVGLEDGPLVDPFVEPGVSQAAGLLYLAVLLTPALLVRSFVHSEAFAAAWIYQVTPVDGPRLVLALRGHIATGFLAPYLVCIAVLLTYLFDSALHAVVHTAVLGLLAGLFLLLSMWVNPGFPFSAPYQRARTQLRTLAPISVAPVVVFGGMPPTLAWAYATPLRVLLLLAALSGVNFGLGRLVARRVAARQVAAHYAG